MTPHEISLLADAVAERFPAVPAQHLCRFDEKTIKAIEDWAQTYTTLRRAAWWAGGIFGGAIIISAAAGFVWVLSVSGRAVLQALGKL